MTWKVIKKWRGKTPNGRPFVAYYLENGSDRWAIASRPEGTFNFNIQGNFGKMTADKKRRILRAIARYEDEKDKLKTRIIEADEIIKIEELFNKKGFDTGIIFPQGHTKTWLEVAIHFYNEEGAGVLRISMITGHLWAIYRREITDKVKEILEELEREYEVLGIGL